MIGISPKDGEIIEIESGKTEMEYLVDLLKQYKKLIIKREGNLLAVFNNMGQPVYQKYI